MDLKTQRIFKILGLFIGTSIILVAFYFSPISDFLKKAPLTIENISKEILTPGPLTASKEKEIKEVLSDKEIIKITNDYRQKNSLKTLRENDLLNKAAMERVDDMFEKQYFAHVTPEGKDVSDTLNNVHYFYVVAGENLALGYFTDSKDLVDAWMGSEGHRENILSPKFREIGVAHKIGMFKGKQQYIAVQVFGTSTQDCPLPSDTLKNSIEAKENEINSLQNTIKNLEIEINNLKSQRDAVYNESNSLFNEGKSQIAQGNSLISQGNQIYSQTKDKTLAETYWSQGETLQKQGQLKIDEANSKNTTLQSLQSQLQQKINYYNSLISQVNTAQSLVQAMILNYNTQLDNFNKCVGG